MSAEDRRPYPHVRNPSSPASFVDSAGPELQKALGDLFSSGLVRETFDRVTRPPLRVGDVVQDAEHLRTLPIGSRVVLEDRVGAERIEGADHWGWHGLGMVVDSEHCMAFDDVVVHRVGYGDNPRV